MKRIIIIIVVSFISGILSAQTHTKNLIQREQLIGSWYSTDLEGKYTHFLYLFFNADSTLKVISTQDTAKGTWSLNDNNLQMNLTYPRQSQKDHHLSFPINLTKSTLDLWTVGVKDAIDSKFEKIDP